MRAKTRRTSGSSSITRMTVACGASPTDQAIGRSEGRLHTKPPRLARIVLPSLEPRSKGQNASKPVEHSKTLATRERTRDRRDALPALLVHDSRFRGAHGPSDGVPLSVLRPGRDPAAPDASDAVQTVSATTTALHPLRALAL